MTGKLAGLSRAWHDRENLKSRAFAVVGGPARGRVVLTLAAVLGLSGADTGTISAATSNLERVFHVGNTEIGLLLSIVALVGAAFTVPAGVLIDRTTRTRLLAGSIGLWAAAQALSGAANSYLWLLLARVALGVVTATAAPAVASITGDYFPASSRARQPRRARRARPRTTWQCGPSAGAMSSRSTTRSCGPIRLTAPSGGRSVTSAANTHECGHHRRVRARVFLLHRAADVRDPVRHQLLRHQQADRHLPHPHRRRRSGRRRARRRPHRRPLACSRPIRARVLVPTVCLFGLVPLLAPAFLTTSVLVALPLLTAGAFLLGAPNPPLDAARLDIMHPRLWGRAEGARTVLRSLGDAGAPLLFGYVSQYVFGGPGSASAGGSAAGRTASGTGLADTFLVMLMPLLIAALLALFSLRTYPRDVATATASVRATSGGAGDGGQHRDREQRQASTGPAHPEQ